MLYWLTGTAASAARFYYEDAHATAARPSRPPSPSAWPRSGATSAASAASPHRDHKNIVHWSVFDHGGHFAAHKAPDLLVGDVRTFFRRFR